MKKHIMHILLPVLLVALAACAGEGSGAEPPTPDETPSAMKSAAPSGTVSTEESAAPSDTISAEESSAPSHIAPSEEGAAPSSTVPVTESTAPSGTAPAVESTALDTEEEENTMLNIQVGDAVFTATLAKNSSVDALKELLADGPLTLYMEDYAGMEKGADLGVTLPQNNQQMNTQAGDIILYQGRTFVIYYDTNSWSLTPIGKINDVDAGALRAALGDGDVTVILSLT